MGDDDRRIEEKEKRWKVRAKSERPRKERKEMEKGVWSFG